MGSPFRKIDSMRWAACRPATSLRCCETNSAWELIRCWSQRRRRKNTSSSWLKSAPSTRSWSLRVTMKGNCRWRSRQAEAAISLTTCCENWASGSCSRQWSRAKMSRAKNPLPIFFSKRRGKSEWRPSFAGPTKILTLACKPFAPPAWMRSTSANCFDFPKVDSHRDSHRFRFFPDVTEHHHPQRGRGGNGQNSAQDAAQQSGSNQHRHNDCQRMQPDSISHDFWGDNKTFDGMHDPKDGNHHHRVKQVVKLNRGQYDNRNNRHNSSEVRNHAQQARDE